MNYTSDSLSLFHLASLSSRYPPLLFSARPAKANERLDRTNKEVAKETGQARERKEQAKRNSFFCPKKKRDENRMRSKVIRTSLTRCRDCLNATTSDCPIKVDN